MALTDSLIIANAVTFKVQAKVLENLRDELIWANPAFAEQGDFSPGFDTLMFTAFADLTPPSTPLTEGSAPTPDALAMTTVTLDTDQYGQTVNITDVAKVKSPQQLVSIASERLTRSAKNLLDNTSRDVVAAGGTPYFAGTANAARADLAATDIAAVAELKRMKWQMFKSKIPLPADGYYRLIADPDVSSDLTSDDDFIEANKYGNAMQLFKNEVGSIGGFRVISNVNGATASSTTTVHLSIAMGDIKGWGAGELQSLSVYHVAAGGDHSDPLAQSELLGFKVNFGIAVLNNGYYFRYESAASDLTP
jgi:N4-gp56 family major capsid protein